MSMDHKAYSFDWNAFERELLPILNTALSTNDPHQLQAFVDRHLPYCSDPYEGEPLNEDWSWSLENRDVHEFGDYSLTKYYDPKLNHGVSHHWLNLQETLPPEAQSALLGFLIGPAGKKFNPGRMGSYFQRPTDILQSLSALKDVEDYLLYQYVRLLEEAGERKHGLYITF